MAVAFHRGLTTELRMKLQLTGLRIEEIDAQRALSGLLTREVDQRGNPVQSNDNKKAVRSGAAEWIEEAVQEVLGNHLEIQREWVERNPGVDPFPPIFAEVVLGECRSIDADNPMETIMLLIDLAEGELMFG